MRERSIVVPESYFNIVYDWALIATGEQKVENGKERFVVNEPAAKLINVFLYHYDNRYANRILVELVERAMNKHQKYLRELGDWLPYSIDYMSELLLNTHGLNQIVAARKKLLEIGFISDNVPEEIPAFYSRSHSWYKFEIENIRDWLDNVWYPSRVKAETEPAKEVEVRKVLSTVTGQVPKSTNGTSEGETPDTLTKQINALGKFYIHIHDKNVRWEFDSERKSRVRARLKGLIPKVGESRAISICAQAIIGNVLSDFHQARHPDNMLGQVSEKTGNPGKVFDDIGEYIFKTGTKLDNMVSHAENAGVTEEIALKEFQEFLKGNPSKFAKGTKKEAQRSNTAQSNGIQVDSETAKPYRLFAREIVIFFSTNVPTKEIKELVVDNKSLAKMGKGLVDTEILFSSLLDAAKSNNGSVSDKTQARMREFSAQFCEIQEFNQ